MESNFFVLQVTTEILREGGSAVQRVYNEKFSNHRGSCGDVIWKLFK